MEMTKDLYNFKVTWSPFLLRPNLPPDGQPKSNFGPHTPGAQRLINVGKEVGIDFTYKLDRYPNTLLGHCALEYALLKDPSGQVQNEVQERLFKSYFSDGTYPNSESVSSIAAQCGLQIDEVKSYINSTEIQQKTKYKALEYSHSGVTGVPYFIMNGHGMMSGAQDPETFVQTFKIAAEKFPLSAM